MKRNFLILMLLSLLPLAGWAQTAITGLTAETTITYGDLHTVSVIDANGQVVPAANYTVEYFTDEACTEANKMSGTDTKTFNQGNYWVQVTADGNSYSGTLKQALTIEKAELTVQVGVDADFAMNFKATTKPTLPTETWSGETATSAKITIKGAKNSEAITDILTVGSGGSYSYASEGTANLVANANPSGTLLDAENPGYKIDFTNSKIALKTSGTGAKGGNYTLKFADRYMKIKQIAIDLSDSKFAITRGASYNPASKPKYTGVAQNLTYTVTYQWGTSSQIYTLTSSDIEVRYANGGTTYKDAIDALEYTPVVFAKAGGNFYTENYTTESATGVAPTTSDDLKYEIEKVGIAVILNQKTKTYDGEKFGEETTSLISQATFTVSPLLGKDAGKQVYNLEAGASPSETLSKDVKYNESNEVVGYSLEATATSITAARIGNASTGDLLTKNYKPTVVASQWIINKKDASVKATADAIEYGGTVGAITITATNAISDTEKNAIEACYVGTVDEANLQQGDNTITIALKPVSSYSGIDDEAKAAAKADAEAVLKNYKITLTPSTLKVNGAGLTITPTIDPTMEYGSTPNPSYVALNSTTHAVVTPAATPTYEYKDTEAETPTWGTTVPKAVGKYAVRVVANNALAPAQFDASKITYNTVYFEITPKELDFTIGQVELHNGDTKTTLNKYAKISLKEGYTMVKKADNTDETLDLVFSFKTGVSGLTVGAENTDYAITGTEGTTYAAIEVALTEDGEYNGNYRLKAGVVGNLKIAEGRTLFVDGADADVNNKIQDASIACNANAATKYNVTFADDRTLKANEWNAVVLPFAITPLEFCNAKCTVDGEDYVNDYAIFNVLTKADKAKNTMKFSLTINEIPANIPFLVKPSKDIKFMRTKTEGTETTKYYLTFEGRKVEYKAEPKVTVDDVNFIGTYKNLTGVAGGAKIMFVGVGEDGHYTFLTATDNGVAYSINVLSTRAYLDFNGTPIGDTSAPIITVEEADGSTTAISGIIADGVAVKAEGWYNINGVKLEGVPTQKGIYINNGKKIVVK